MAPSAQGHTGEAEHLWWTGGRLSARPPSAVQTEAGKRLRGRPALPVPSPRGPVRRDEGCAAIYEFGFPEWGAV